jgi:hypothetical protein
MASTARSTQTSRTNRTSKTTAAATTAASTQQPTGRSAVGNVGPTKAEMEAAKQARIDRVKAAADAKAAAAGKPTEGEKPANEPAVKSTPRSYRAKRAAKSPDLYLDDDQLIAAVRDHAREHYDDGGWDYVVEAWDDAYLLEQLGWTDTLAGAIRKLGPTIRLWASVDADRMADAKNSA